MGKPELGLRISTLKMLDRLLNETRQAMYV
jgi:hypothetical protein